MEKKHKYTHYAQASEQLLSKVLGILVIRL